MLHLNLKLTATSLCVALASCQSVQAPKPVTIKPIIVKTVKPVSVKIDKGLNVINSAIELVKSKQLNNAQLVLKGYLEGHDDNRARLNLALIYFKTKQFILAKGLLQTIQQSDRHNSIVLEHLAIIARHEGQFKKAKRLYLQALENSDRPSIHLNYAILLDLYLNQLDEALKHYTLYQETGLAANKDIPLDKWIADLNRRIKRNQ